jgi:thiamine-monophosphate kinase
MSEASQNLTELSSLGEFGLIDHLTKSIILKHKSTVKGVGDDAAVIQPAEGKQLLVSKDLLIEGVHFDLIYTPLKHLGYKAVVVNLSDIAAMNGTPKQIIVGIGISSKYTLEAIEEIYSGILMACDVYNIDFIGGDTTSSLAGLNLSVTVIGEADKMKITYRNGAKPNDLICVSGDLGGAYMGLLLLEREKKAFQVDPNLQPDLSGNDYLLERQLKPEARIDVVRLLEEKKIVPTSMIDVSDGLASEVLHLCKESKTGCIIHEEKIPVDQVTFEVAKEFGIVPSIAALNGGEDYELLFTISQSDYDKIKNEKEITVVGYMTEEKEGQHMVTNDNQMIKLEAQGWDALRKRELDV